MNSKQNNNNKQNNNLPDQNGINIVEFIKEHYENTLTEPEIKYLFNKYSDGADHITDQQMISFIKDLLQSQNLSLVVPNQALTTTLSEFALNVEECSKVTLQEFKSFFLYFHSKPFVFILETIRKCFNIPLENLRRNSLILSFFLSEQWLEKNIKSEQTNQNKSTKNLNSIDIDLIKLRNDIIKQFYEMEIDMENCQIFTFFSISRRRFDGLLVFDNEYDFQIFNTIRRHPLYLMDLEVTARPYKGEQLPRPAITEHTTAANLAANGILLARRAFTSISNIAAELKISEKTDQAKRSAEKVIADIEKNDKICRTSKNISESTSQLTRQASVKVADINEKYGIKDGYDKVKSDISEQLTTLKEKPAVRKSLHYMNKMLSTAANMAHTFTDETMNIVGNQSQKSKQNLETVSEENWETGQEEKDGDKNQNKGKEQTIIENEN